MNYSVYGVRKMWHALKRLGEHIGRDQVARLMRLAGVRGVSRRRRQRRVSSEGPLVRAEDLVRRDWFRHAPDVVWVADFSYVWTREGWMYVSFLQDAFSRRTIDSISSIAARLIDRLFPATLKEVADERIEGNARLRFALADRSQVDGVLGESPAHRVVDHLGHRPVRRCCIEP